MDESIDNFLEYIGLVEESAEQFSNDQVQKLELIRTKVGEILKRVNPPATAPISSPATVAQPIVQSMPALPITEKIVKPFDKFVEGQK